jgi:hypothetical protein
MSEGHTKSKIISFRVSENEYGAVEEASRKHGFASVSLFARSATLMRDSSVPMQFPLDAEISRLWRRVDVLTTALEQITAHLGIAPDLVNAG